MDINPFDDVLRETAARRTRLQQNVERLKADMASSTWMGPRATRFEENERQLLGDLDDVVDKLVQVEQTLGRLSDELEDDLEAARQLRDSILSLVPGVGSIFEKFADWPAQWGNDPPRPGEDGWPEFRRWASSRVSRA